ncbi:Floral homeotic APETALA 3 -like protein [Gossypium arboreum]|uniref:Floral homeotic APETALA 3-like protein n=1 Tax=Gossypium arboreum TaxID=29729 RepID=A0A0B0MFT9_GOSAR|nr:Floral homeotic APETALA 3 -like protein [Gossypium arboreum]
MGRVKLKIKKLENPNGRQATYAKRKHGIMKKANELSILCDVEIVLLMFSPTNKPSLCIGKRSSIEEIIEKFAQLTPQERAKRKLESLEENLGKQQQLLSLECTSQFQNEMQVPYRMGLEHQLQTLSWLPNQDSRHIALSDDPNLIPHRDVECSASSSFGSYSGYFGTGKSSEPSSSGQENSILNDLSGNGSLQLQLGGQCPLFSYNLNILNDPKFPPVAEMNFNETPADYQVNGALQGPRTGFDTAPGSWASTSGSCAVTMFDEPLYTRLQQH